MIIVGPNYSSGCSTTESRKEDEEVTEEICKFIVKYLKKCKKSKERDDFVDDFVDAYEIYLEKNGMTRAQRRHKIRDLDFNFTGAIWKLVCDGICDREGDWKIKLVKK